MDFDDLFAVGFFIFIGLVAIGLVYLVAYGYLWKPTVSEGVVSSFVKSCNPLYCTQTVEFYGGAYDRWLVDPRAEVIKPQKTCHSESRGIYLVNVSCK